MKNLLRRRNRPVAASVVVLCVAAGPRLCMAAGGPLYDAMDQMIDEFASDAPALSENVKRVAITSVVIVDDVDEGLGEYVAKGIEKAAAETPVKVLRCVECFVARAETRGAEVVIAKGIRDREELSTIASRLGVPHHAEVVVGHSGTSATLRVSVYSTSTSKLAWSEHYTKRVITLGKYGLRLWASASQAVNFAALGFPVVLRCGVGQAIYGFGSIGLFASFVLPSEKVPFHFSFGPQVSINLNETILPAWRWGALSIKGFAGLGFAESRDIFMGGGLKTTLGALFYVDIDYLHALTLEPKAGNHTFGMLALGFGVELG